jgi:O-methyltransferase
MPSTDKLDLLLTRYPLVSDQVNARELKVVLRELQHVLDRDVAGDIVELGCYEGTTSLFMQRLLDGSGRRLYLYDSFEGLPPKTPQDLSPAGEQFRAGELRASKATLIGHFNRAGLP